MIPENSYAAYRRAAAAFAERSCSNNGIALIQAAFGAGNMNQSLSPIGFSLG
jgi:hypothetical protein